MVQTNPLHVLVETTLVLTILVIVLYRRRTDWRKTGEQLSEKEQEALLAQLRTPGAPTAQAAE